MTVRTAWFARSRVVTLIGRPHLDLFHQEKLIPANMDSKLKFFPNTSAFLLKTLARDHDHPQVNYKVQITGARLLFRTKHIAPSLILGQETVLQTKNFSIPFNKVINKTLTIPTGTSQIEFDNVYQGKLPDLVIVTMVSDTDMGVG